MNLTAILELARNHVGKAEMRSSAEMNLQDAYSFQRKGNVNTACHYALKSLAYSIGILHADYAKAWKFAGYKGDPKVPSIWQVNGE